MKKLISLIMLLSLLLPAVTPLAHASNGDTPNLGLLRVVADSSGGAAEVDFTTLGYKARRLKGPYAVASYYFSLPAHWQPAEGAQLQLELDSWGVDDATGTGGLLEVSLNDVQLDTIPVELNRTESLTLDIPPEAFATSGETTRHRLKLVFENDEACGTNQHATVQVQPESRLTIPFDIAELTSDLTRLPYPLFQQTFVPEQAVLVVPNQPTPAELQAALTVAAGFGRMTGGDLALTLVPENQLTRDMQETSHLILVGKPDTLLLSEDVDFPQPAAAGFDSTLAGTDDGIIQIAPSPWNAANAVLWVGGGNDTGLVKAAQAVSSGVLRSAGRPDVAVVRQVNMEALTTAIGSTDQTLADLGYKLQTLEGKGTASEEYKFIVPAGRVADEGIYFDLVSAHSTLLNYEKSGVLIKINDELVGSVRLSDATADLNTTRVHIPRTAVHPGVNRLVVEAWFEPVSNCDTFKDASLWMAIRPESGLHMPLTDVDGTAEPNQTLADFPNPFAQNFTLGDTAFVLPSANPAVWNVAVQLAAGLGNAANAPLSNLNVNFDNLPESGSRHVLLVGQPQELPAVESLADALPAPYQPGSNTLNQDSLPFVYAVPDNVGVGVLQLARLPENSRQTVLAVLGNSDDGVQQAADALLDKTQRHQLVGDVAVVDASQILVASTHPAPVAPAVVAPADAAGSQPVVQAAAQPVIESVASRPLTVGQYNPWMLPLLAVSVAAMIIIAVAASVGGLRKRRTGQAH